MSWWTVNQYWTGAQNIAESEPLITCYVGAAPHFKKCVIAPGHTLEEVMERVDAMEEYDRDTMAAENQDLRRRIAALCAKKVEDHSHRATHSSPALTAREGEAMVQRYEASRYSGMIPSSVGGWVKYTDYAALAERVRVLEECLGSLMSFIDKGMLVRDVSRDYEQGWYLKMLPLIRALSKAKALLAQPAQSGETDKQAPIGGAQR